jgi:hypothetical protein
MNRIVVNDLEIIDDTVVKGDLMVEKDLKVNGVIAGNITGNLSGNVLPESKLASTVELMVGTEEVVLDGASSVTTLDIPANSIIYLVKLINKKAVTDDDGDDTYVVAFSGGSTENINGGSPVAGDMNTKVTEKFNNILTDGTTNITFTPNGTNFTGGVVKAEVFYGVVEALPDYTDKSTMTVIIPEELVKDEAFTLKIEEAVDFWGDPLTGTINVTVASDVSADPHPISGVVFTEGSATLEGLVLNTEGEQNITVTVVGVTDPVVLVRDV